MKIILFLFLLSPGITVAKELFNASEIYALVEPSTCAILTLDKKGNELTTGSGFIISKTGDVITNRHVIAGAYEALVECGKHKGKVNFVSAIKAELDLVKLNTTLQNTIALNLSEKSNDKVGSIVFIIGNPFGLSSSLTSGLISGYRTYEEANYIQIDGNINPGNSGGPVVNINGEVIGIATSRHSKAQGIGFSLNVSEIKKLHSVNLNLQTFINNLKINDHSKANLFSDLKISGVALGTECSKFVDILSIKKPIKRTRSYAKTDFGQFLADENESPQEFVQVIPKQGSNNGQMEFLGETSKVTFECLEQRVVNIKISGGKIFSAPRQVEEALNIKYGDTIQLGRGDRVWSLSEGKYIEFNASGLSYSDEKLKTILERKAALKLLLFKDL